MRTRRERALSFDQAVDDQTCARFAGRRPAARFRTRTFAMGVARVPLDKALRLASQLEDDALMRRLKTHR